MNRDEINPMTVAGLDFDAVRVTDEGFPHYIELRERGSETLLARVNYYGPDGSIDLVMGGNPVPRAIVEALFELADRALAYT